MANLGQAVKINDSNVAEYEDNTLAQTAFFWGGDKKKDHEKEHTEKPAMSHEEKKRHDGTNLIKSAIDANNNTLPGDMAAILGSSGGAPQKPMVAGPAPKPQDKIFSAIVTEPTQIEGAIESL